MKSSTRTYADDTRTGIDSIETGIQLLFCFGTLGGRSHRLKLLAETAGMPPSKAHRYLVSFERMGLVERNATNGHYRLGPKAAELGAVALDAMEPLALATEVLIDLRDELAHTVALSIWGSNSPVIVRVEEADRLITVNVRVGKSLPLLNSAAGLLFSAFLPQSTIRPLLVAEIKANSSLRQAGRLVRSMAQAERLMAEVRARGIACNDEYTTAGSSSLAVPVFAQDGKLVAVLSLIGPTGTFDMSWGDKMIAALRRRTLATSRKQGFEGVAEGLQDIAAEEARVRSADPRRRTPRV